MSAMIWFLWSIMGLLFVVPLAYSASTLPLEKIKLPTGFSISIYARDVPECAFDDFEPERDAVRGNTSGRESVRYPRS